MNFLQKHLTKDVPVRFGFYFLGLLILTLGIALSIVSKLGASPFDALLVGLYNNFGFTVGSWEYILGAIMLLINSAVQRKKVDLKAMVTAVITGFGIDFWLFVLTNTWEPKIMLGRLIVFILGILLIGLGIAAYLQADFAPSPLDATMLVIQEYFGVKISIAKNIMMFFFLILAIIFKGPIALGTLIMVLAGGPAVGWFLPRMEALKKKKVGLGAEC